VKLGYNELGYNELGYNELGYNEHSVLTNEYYGPELFVITKFRCIITIKATTSNIDDT